MKKQGKCVHFNGTANACCEAGINYQQLAGPGPAPIRRLPCFGVDYRTGLGNPAPRDEVVASCDKRQEPTLEEIEADEKAVRASLDRVGMARQAIVDHLGGPWKKGMAGASGTIPCSCCGGELHFSRSGYNGHIHAHCSGQNCVSWME